MNKLAVIKTGGKQYKVSARDRIKVEKLRVKEGESFEFSEVLLVADGKDVKVGKPKVEAKVAGKVLMQGRAKKVNVVKYKPKTRYKKVYGHKQPFTEVKIEKIA
jgi:large subunit ribosomal protein L21